MCKQYIYTDIHLHATWRMWTETWSIKCLSAVMWWNIHLKISDFLLEINAFWEHLSQSYSPIHACKQLSLLFSCSAQIASNLWQARRVEIVFCTFSAMLLVYCICQVSSFCWFVDCEYVACFSEALCSLVSHLLCVSTDNWFYTDNFKSC